MATVTVSKTKIEREKGVVILPIEEYKKLLERSVPTYYLAGKEATNLDKLVEEGLKEYRSGRIIKAASLKDALKTHASGKKNRR